MAKRDRASDENENVATENTQETQSTETFPETRAITVQGIQLELPMVYKPGHVCDFRDALFLSTMHMSQAMNSFADRAKAMKTGNPEENVAPASDDEIKEAAREHFSTYQWSPRGTAEVVDPVQREVRAIARNEITAAARARNLAFNRLPKETQEGAIAKHIAAHSDRLTQEAEARLANARKVVSDDILAGLV